MLNIDQVNAFIEDPEGGWGRADKNEFMMIQEQLRKAMSAGAAVPSYAGGGTAWQLIPQSIEGTLVIATARQEHCTFMKDFPRTGEKLGATIEEFTIEQSLGEDLEGFAAEGELGPNMDSEWERMWERVAFMSHVRSLTDPASLMTTIGSRNMLAKLDMNGALKTLLMLENAGLYGDRTMNPYSVDGLFTAGVRSNEVVDCRGEPLDTDLLMDAASEIIEGPNYGNPNEILISVGTKADYHKFGASHLHVLQTGGVQLNTAQAYKAGVAIVGLEGPNGPIPFKTNVFLQPAKFTKTTSIGEDAPAAPTLSSVVAAPNAGSLFGSTDAGDYIWKIRACMASAKSAPTATSATAVASGDGVTITVAAPAVNVLYYEVFRSKKDDTDVWLITRVAQTYAGAAPAATVITDLNGDLPGCSKAAIYEKSTDVMEYKQLLDFARVPLAKTKLALPFAFVSYFMLKWKLTRRIKTFKNIGRATMTEGA